MKRQTLVEYKDALPEVQAIYDEVMEVVGSPDVFNFLKAFGNNEKVLRAFWSMLRYTLIEGEVPALLKQLILFSLNFARYQSNRERKSKQRVAKKVARSYQKEKRGQASPKWSVRGRPKPGFC